MMTSSLHKLMRAFLNDKTVRGWTATKLEKQFRQHHHLKPKWFVEHDFRSAKKAFTNMPNMLTAIKRAGKGLIFREAKP
jgi:hypothetical protein